METENIGTTFQRRVRDWMIDCFGLKISADTMERNHRFLEESLELVQALGCTASEAHQLVDYVFGRPVGQTKQEIGGVMVTLAALCEAAGYDMEACGEIELIRVWEKIDAIRKKQAAKPKHSPLPEAQTPQKCAVSRDGVHSWKFNKEVLINGRRIQVCPCGMMRESPKEDVFYDAEGRN